MWTICVPNNEALLYIVSKKRNAIYDYIDKYECVVPEFES